MDELTNPFPGLRSFEPEEDYLFFGREARIDDLLMRLREYRFLSIVGTSGSGKSSLVKAGLIPALYGGYMSTAGSRWRAAIMRPGSSPIRNLTAELSRSEVLGTFNTDPDTQKVIIETTLRSSALGLLEVVRQARIPDQDNILILVDQFEELFRFTHELSGGAVGDEAMAFVKLLLAVAKQDTLPVYVVLTMRSDYIGQCMGFPGLPEAINRGQYLVPQLTREEMRATITGPAAVAGGEIAPRLVVRLLNDVGDEADQLPVLQHAMMRCWDYWRDNHKDDEPLDLRHYEAIGTLKKALSQHAEEACAELDRVNNQSNAEKLFKALTALNPEGRGVRRLVQVREICAVSGMSLDEAVHIIDIFRKPGRSFLMPPAGIKLDEDSTVDLSHESLMRGWDRLASWVQEEAESARSYLRICEAAELEEAGRAGLWQDPQLQIHLQWREQYHPTEGWAKRYNPAFERTMSFLDRSKHERDRVVAREEEVRRGQLRRTYQLAITGTLVVLVLLSGIIMYLVMKEKNDELRVKAISFASNAATDPVIKALLMLELHDYEFPTEDMYDLVYKTRSEILPVEMMHTIKEISSSSSNGSKVVIGSKGVVHIWDVSEGTGQSLGAHEGRVLSVDLSDDGTKAVSSGNDGRIMVWHLNGNSQARGSKEELGRIPCGMKKECNGPPDSCKIWCVVWNVDMSQSGRLVASGSSDGIVRVWDLDSPGTPREVGDLGSPVRSVRFSEDESFIVSGSMDGTVNVWATDKSWSVSADSLCSHRGPVLSVDVSSDGNRVVSGGDDGYVYISKLDEKRNRCVPITGHAGRVTKVDFSPDGKRMVSAGIDGRINIWYLKNEMIQSHRELRGHGGKVVDAGFTAEDTQIVSSGEDGAIRLWSIGDRNVVGMHESLIPAVHFSDNDVISASADGTLRRWDTTATELSGNSFCSIEGASGRLWSFDISPDNKWLAAGEEGGLLIICRLDNSGKPKKIAVHDSTAAIRSVSFDRKGSRLVTGASDGEIRVWEWKDDNDLEMIRELAYPEEAKESEVWSVCFSPDGSHVAVGGRQADGGGWIGLWSLSNSENPLWFKKPPLSSVNSVVFSPDSTRIAGAGTNGTIILLTSKEGKKDRWLTGFGPIYTMDYSPDGTRLIAGDRDGRIMLWRINGNDNPTPVMLGRHEGAILDVAFSPNGRYVISSGTDGTVRRWMVEWMDVVDDLRLSTRVCLSVNERMRYLGESKEDAQKAEKNCKAGKGST